MSLYQDVLTQTKIQLSNLSGLGITNISIRKHERVTEADSLPFLTITPGLESIYNIHSENVVQMVYPVYLTFWQAGNGGLEANISTMLDWREKVRRQFHKPFPLTNLSKIIDGEVGFPANFVPQLFELNLDVGQLEILFLSQEQRDDTSGDPGLP